MIPRQSVIPAVLAAVVLSAARIAAQQPAPAEADAARAALTACAQAHPQAQRTMNLANQRLEVARQSNSGTAMRAALDDMQAALRQLRMDIAPCANVQNAGVTDAHAHAMPAASSAASAAAPEPHAAHVAPSATPEPTEAHAAHVAAATPKTAPARTTPADAHSAHAAATPKSAATGNTHVDHLGAETPTPPDASLTELTTPENLAARLADLTCQPRVDPDTAPRATYMGKAYYFCTAADRDAFLKAPAKYLQR